MVSAEVKMIGIGAVDGMAMAKIYIVNENNSKVEELYIEDSEKEFKRFLDAKEASAGQLRKIMESAFETLGKENAEIFDYQLLMLEDDDFLNRIKDIIEEKKINAEYALDIVSREYIEMFKNIDNDYLKERTTDIEDMVKRITFALSDKELITLSIIKEDVIVAAEDLTPSQTAGINKNRVKGIILEKGGKSSHSVIIARSLGIPCIVGISNLLNNITGGEFAIINGETGEVFLSPGEEEISSFKEYENLLQKEKAELDKYITCESKTIDGFEVKIFANITSENEVASLLLNGGEGVGLLRTEFIYMLGDTPPSEEIQFGNYANIAGLLQGRPLIIRTLDAGGDKDIPYLNIPKEENPFLGYRAIRYCLENKELFKTQISAILRAGIHGNVELMIPMISTIEELRKTKEIIGEVKDELLQKGIEHAEGIRLGMMVETPAAAFMADKFSKEVDFFSIGTNDLTQYLFAADRMNGKVAHLNSYYNPALLKTVRYICECANAVGIDVDICGQAGEIPELVPVWVGMGITNLSVSIPSILKVRRLICKTDKLKAVELVDVILSLDTAQEVETYLKSKRGEDIW